MSHWFDELAQRRTAAEHSRRQGLQTGLEHAAAHIRTPAMPAALSELALGRPTRRAGLKAVALGALLAGPLRGALGPAPAAAARPPCYHECRIFENTRFGFQMDTCLGNNGDWEKTREFFLKVALKTPGGFLTCAAGAALVHQRRVSICGHKDCGDPEKYPPEPPPAPPSPPPPTGCTNPCESAGGTCCGAYTVIDAGGFCVENCESCRNGPCD
jgi:hypothetical protein